MTSQIEQGFVEALDSVAANDEPPEPPHWRASEWSPAVSSTMHTRFVAALKSGRREPNPFRSLDVEPEVSVRVGQTARRFISRAGVEAMWQAQFKRLGFHRRPVTGIYLDHRIYALYDDASTAARVWGLEGMPFHHLSEVLILLEKDVVYPLDGAYYRSDVQVRAWTSTDFTLLDETKQGLDRQVTATIEEFGRQFQALR